MKVIELMHKIGINLEIDSFFKINNEILSATFGYDQLRNTCLEFLYPNKEVLHFTSIESARLILQNGYLRGSNFNNLDDNFEVIHALNLIGSKLSENWENIKKRTFAICFTEKNEENVQENYTYHWENYANHYKGVALEFEFMNLPLLTGYYPLKIQYLNETNKQIKLLSILKKEISGLSDAEKEFILPILSGIKKKKFEKESEVRLIYNISEPEIEYLDNEEQSDVFFSFNSNNSINLELRVPYFTSTESDNKLLKLKTVYFGAKYIQPDDNVSSGIIIERICKKKGVELKYI